MTDPIPQDAAKQDDKPPVPEARCWIDHGILRVEIPLFMVNGEFIAYGMLHKAQGIAANFFKQIQKEISDKRILTPAGMTPRGH